MMLSRYLLHESFTDEHIFLYLNTLELGVFWLDSGVTATQGKSYLGVSDDVALCAAGSETSFLEQLRSRISAHSSPRCSQDQTEFTEPSFALGWVGWFEYEFGVRLLTGTKAEESSDSSTRSTSASMLFVTIAFEFDHETDECWLIAESEQTLSEWLAQHLEALRTFCASQTIAGIQPESQEGVVSPKWRDSKESYVKNIEECQAAINRGDAYLLCLTTQVSLNSVTPPHEVYLRLRKISPTHHSGFIQIGQTALVSASPERFLAVNANGDALTKPIKGTRARGVSDAEDAAVIKELLSNEKELAENLMIVDLMRNDFSRVCPPETIRVTSLHEVEHYSHLHQLVSTVTGALSQGKDSLDLFVACFPAGSMTGTPKLSAVEILAEREQSPRGVYSGCFGYLSRDGALDLAMTIRSIVVCDGIARIGSGGGITALSEVTAEYEEVQLKAEALFSALQITERPVM